MAENPTIIDDNTDNTEQAPVVEETEETEETQTADTPKPRVSAAASTGETIPAISQYKDPNAEYIASMIAERNNGVGVLPESAYYPDNSSILKGQSGGRPIFVASAEYPFAMQDAEIAARKRRDAAQNNAYMSSLKYDYAQTKDNLKNTILIDQQRTAFELGRQHYVKATGSEKLGSIAFAQSNDYKVLNMKYHSLARQLDQNLDKTHKIIAEYGKGEEGTALDKQEYDIAQKYNQSVDMLQGATTFDGINKSLDKLTEYNNQLGFVTALKTTSGDLANTINKTTLEQIGKNAYIKGGLEDMFSKITEKGINALSPDENRAKEIFDNLVDIKYKNEYENRIGAPTKEQFAQATKEKIINQQKNTAIKLRKEGQLAYMKFYASRDDKNGKKIYEQGQDPLGNHYWDLTTKGVGEIVFNPVNPVLSYNDNGQPEKDKNGNNIILQTGTNYACKRIEEKNGKMWTILQRTSGNARMVNHDVIDTEGDSKTITTTEYDLAPNSNEIRVSYDETMSVLNTRGVYKNLQSKGYTKDITTQHSDVPKKTTTQPTKQTTTAGSGMLAPKKQVQGKVTGNYYQKSN